MSEDLLPRILIDYEDYGSLHVKGVEQRDQDLFISLVLPADEDLDLPNNIRVTCRYWHENTLVPGHCTSVGLTQVV